MTEEPLHEQMARYDALDEQAREAAREREALGAEIGERLAEAISGAITEQGASVESVERSRDGHRHRFEARLDRAALVAAVLEKLPDGFVVSHVNGDGSLSVEWTGRRETPAKRGHGAVLKAVVAEEMVTDADGLVESVPTRERVLARAMELGIDEGDAADRLARLETLNVVDVTDDGVYPDENFSRL